VVEQRLAEQEIEAARAKLQDSLEQLQRLQSRFPKSEEIKMSISRLEEMLKQVQQAQNQANVQAAQAQQAAQEAGPLSISDATVAAIAEQTEKLKQTSEMTQARAADGAKIAAAVLADSEPPSRPPINRPPPRHARTEHAQHADRSPASVAPDETPAPPTPQSDLPSPGANTDDESAWFNKLKNGLLHYGVPGTMLWKVPTTVTVQINGEKDTATAPIDNQSGQASIRVARHMKVLIVNAPQNPDEFTIAAEPDTQLEQYVPEDGPTTWHFSVTPRYTASSQKLMVRAWVIYDANTERELPVFTGTVDVHVPGLRESLKRLFEGDPDYWLKYGLPGGAGFVFFSGLVTGIWKWFGRKKGRNTPLADGH
jgi:hypothetical protein